MDPCFHYLSEESHQGQPQLTLAHLLPLGPTLSGIGPEVIWLEEKLCLKRAILKNLFFSVLEGGILNKMSIPGAFQARLHGTTMPSATIYQQMFPLKKGSK